MLRSLIRPSIDLVVLSDLIQIRPVNKTAKQLPVEYLSHSLGKQPLMSAFSEFLSQLAGINPRLSIRQLFLTDSLLDYLILDMPASLKTTQELETYLSFYIADLTGVAPSDQRISWRLNSATKQILVCHFSLATERELTTQCLAHLNSQPTIIPLFSHLYDQTFSVHKGSQSLVVVHMNETICLLQNKQGWFAIDRIKVERTDTNYVPLISARLAQLHAIADMDENTPIHWIDNQSGDLPAIGKLLISPIPAHVMQKTCLVSQR